MEDLGFLIDIFERVDVFLLILVRLIGFFVILPILSGANIPAMIRMSFSVGFAFMVYVSGLYVDHSFWNDSILGFFWLVVGEFFIGFTMAYVVYIVFSLLYLVGQFMDDSIGFNMVSVMDPASQIQVPVIGNLLYLMAMVMLVIGGGLNRLLFALFGSFQVAPIGINFFANEALPMYVIGLIVTTFYMGLQIAMPVVGALLAINISLGLLVKTVPQMNIFAVGIPLRMFLGLIILFVVIPVFGTVFTRVFEIAYNAVIDVILALGAGQ